ncbi:hypothetical protein [Corallococcus carmarthensis]|uniref:Lipoprotein n=1 Tax=Corallococcus carmarthensis TaxID=2316728 RepID=A0A3A8KQQ2_9BACT|nr:hypothetical protein [Corallococcus carmarthensis]NOK16262.1 hypothetical protein [Corallococcus carmarthensis]RKH04304.1 hypothetical protein D7X32_11570 [Corallococcus carmarthensis]
MRRLLVAAVLLSVLGGCANTPPIVGEPAPTLDDPKQEAAYLAVLDRYSDRQEIYDGFDTRVFAGATFQTPSFRDARIHRRALFQTLPAAKVEQLIAEEQADAEKFYEFFLGVHVNDYRYDDFAHRNSIWRIALVTPAGEITPVEIRRLGRADLNVRAYYPYTSLFWVAYRVRFPKTFANGQPVIPEGTEQVMLRVASSLGNAELKVSAR